MGFDIMQAQALQPYRGKMLYPIERDNRAQIEQFLRDHSDTEYHPIGTCKMGPADDPWRWWTQSCGCTASKACAW